jgi:hypothetical protein
MIVSAFKCRGALSARRGNTFMETKRKESPSYIAAKSMLPSELHPILDELLTDYRFAAFRHHGKEWASPKVIAELVLMGWRSSMAPTPVNDATKK